MKNTHIIILVLVLIALALFFGLKGKTLEAPEDDINVDVNAPVTNTMPAPGFEGTDVEEKVVVGETKEFTVTGTNFAFEPKLITVKKGDKVRINFKSTQGFHDFVVDEFGAATKQLQSPGTEVIEFIANKTGSFQYYCSVGTHRQQGMVGTLKVE